jgi:hypothetical protein
VGNTTVINGQVYIYSSTVEIKNLKIVGGANSALACRNSNIIFTGEAWIESQKYGIEAINGSVIDFSGVINFTGTFDTCIDLTTFSKLIVRYPSNLRLNSIIATSSVFRLDYCSITTFYTKEQITGTATGLRFKIYFNSGFQSLGGGRAAIPGTLEGIIDATSWFDSPTQKWEISISFRSSAEIIYEAIPTWVKTGYVTTRYTNVAGTLGLQIAATNSSEFTDISTSFESLTDLANFAGTVVKLKVTGMNAAATVATFGLRFVE